MSLLSDALPIVIRTGLSSATALAAKQTPTNIKPIPPLAKPCYRTSKYSSSLNSAQVANWDKLFETFFKDTSKAKANYTNMKINFKTKPLKQNAKSTKRS